jgi:hypothetical protein
MRPTTSTLLVASSLFGLSTATTATLTPTSAPSLSPQPFLNALDPFLEDLAFLAPAQQSSPIINGTESPNPVVHDFLKKRQAASTGCPSSFNSCASAGAANLCCYSGATCTVDFSGRSACCPVGAVCTGTVSGVVTAGTLSGNGQLVKATPTSGATGNSGNGGIVTANSPAPTTNFASVQQTTFVQGGSNGQTSNGGFIVAGTNTVATIGAAVRGVEIVSIALRVPSLQESCPFANCHVYDSP